MSEIRLKLHPRQSLAFLSKATEIFYMAVRRAAAKAI